MVLVMVVNPGGGATVNSGWAVAVAGTGATVGVGDADEPQPASAISTRQRPSKVRN
jgi:Mrp family chromosome partitioning ATPase